MLYFFVLPNIDYNIFIGATAAITWSVCLSPSMSLSLTVICIYIHIYLSIYIYRERGEIGVRGQREQREQREKRDRYSETEREISSQSELNRQLSDWCRMLHDSSYRDQTFPVSCFQYCRDIQFRCNMSAKLALPGQKHQISISYISRENTINHFRNVTLFLDVWVL